MAHAWRALGDAWRMLAHACASWGTHGARLAHLGARLAHLGARLAHLGARLAAWQMHGAWDAGHPREEHGASHRVPTDMGLRFGPFLRERSETENQSVFGKGTVRWADTNVSLKSKLYTGRSRH